MWTFKKSSKVAVRKHTPLTDAVLRSDYSGMRNLIAEGADVDEFDDDRMTLLLWAIMRGDSPSAPAHANPSSQCVSRTEFGVRYSRR